MAIAAVLAFGSMLTSLATIVGKGGENIDKAKEVIDRVGTAYNVLNTTSISQSAGRVLISPMVAIERSLIHQEYAQDLMTIINLRDIKDALTHLAMQGQVDGIKIASLVDSINPRRAGFLAYQGLEAFGGSPFIKPEKTKAEIELEKKDPNYRESKTVTISGKEYTDFTTYAPLALGRTVQASVQIGSTMVNFPLNFRQVPVPVSSNDLEAIFEAARPEEGLFGRYMMLQSGELTSPEFLTGTDQIKREFNIRMNDMSGYYKEATDRSSKNKMAALKTGIMSMNTMANTIIMSQETATQIEMELGVKFNKSGIAAIRKKVLANTIVIVDDGMGIFTFWNSGSNMKEEYTRKEISVITKKENSMDLSSLMKLFVGR